MRSLLVLIPVLDRPAAAAPVVASIRSSTPHARILFLCSPGDDAEIAAALATGANVTVVPWQAGSGDWARKQNHGFRDGVEEWVFLGADDLVFHSGWFYACIRQHEIAGACVVGTNDLGNARVVAGRHSTHSLVHRDYLECGTIDEDGLIVHEGYDHQFADDEFVQTAIARGTYAHAGDARVEHLHPNWGKAQDDATYRKGQQQFAQDRVLFERRQQFWRPTTPGPRRRG